LLAVILVKLSLILYYLLPYPEIEFKNSRDLIYFILLIIEFSVLYWVKHSYRYQLLLKEKTWLAIVI
ncbi:hypothetical protein, partial [Chlamydia trachomatis]|uniref:hypothetical protein n=1 Tax=Chlamydia trachomatis TaxID=813 RepID=UPI001AD7E93D